jgi:hypothetical protein
MEGPIWESAGGFAWYPPRLEKGQPPIIMKPDLFPYRDPSTKMAAFLEPIVYSVAPSFPSDQVG